MVQSVGSSPDKGPCYSSLSIDSAQSALFMCGKWVRFCCLSKASPTSHVCAKGNAPCCAIYRLRSRCPKKIHTITMPAVLGEIKVRLKFYPVLLPWHDSLPDKCSLLLFPSSSSLSCRSACSRSGWMSVPAPSVAGQVAAPTLWTCGTRPQWWIVGLWVLCLWQLNLQRCAPAQAENSPISPVPHIPETPATTVECAWTLSMATGELFSSALFLIFFSYLIPAVTAMVYER